MCGARGEMEFLVGRTEWFPISSVCVVEEGLGGWWLWPWCVSGLTSSWENRG